MNAIVGAWKLVSIQWEDAASGALTDMYGSQPLGSLIFSQSGRMSATLMSSDRHDPKDANDEAALFRSMMAYAAAYTLEGTDTLLLDVDAAWFPSWIGGRHVRYYQLNGDVLSIRSARTTHPKWGSEPGCVVMVWNRA